MINWKRNIIIGLVVCFAMALICVYLTVTLRNDLRRGKIAFEQIRLYKGGNVYKVDQIEGLGRSKYFLSFKQED